MAKVVIFGVVDTAQLAKYYLENDSEHEVIAFTVTKDYIESEQFEGLPVVPFEEVEQHYPPSEYHLFVPMTASKMNKNRRRFYEEGKAKGYRFASFSPTRIVSPSGKSVSKGVITFAPAKTGPVCDKVLRLNSVTGDPEASFIS